MRRFGVRILLAIFLTLWNFSTVFSQPKWATQPPPASRQYLYGVGIAHGTKEAIRDQQRADDAARADIIRQVRVTVSSRLTTITTETSRQGIVYDTRQVVESAVSFTLEGAEIRERFYDKKNKTSYALARLNRQDAARRLGEKIRVAAIRADALIGQSDRHRAGGAVYRALVALLQAAEERASVEMEENVYRVLDSGSVDALLEEETGSTSPFAPGMAFIDGRIGGLLNGLVFTDVKGDRQSVRQGRVSEPVLARLTLGIKKNATPAGGFPVRFRISQGYGMVEPQGISGPDGGIALAIRRLTPGGASYSEVTAEIDTSTVRAQIPAGQAVRWLWRLGQIHSRFTFLPGEYGFEDGMAELAGRLVVAMPEKATVTVGRFTYADTRGAGPFTGPLRQHLGAGLAQTGRVRLVESSSYAVRTGPDDMEMLIRTAQTDGVVWGEYRETGDSVVVQARITGRDGIRLADAGITLPRGAIGQTVRPPSLDADLPSAPVSGLPVLLWTDRGDGAVYAGGERLIVYVRTESDAYLRLLYQQADGQVIQIFPNRMSGDERVMAGRTYVVPAPDASYQFAIQPPFGVEYLMAIASAAPLPPLTGQEVNGGVALRGGLREVVQRLIAGKTWYGQTVCRITTVQP